MKMKTALLTLVFVPLLAFSQQFQWLQIPDVAMPYNPELVGYANTTDNQGNLWVSGFNSAPFIYNTIMGNVFLKKYNSEGNELTSTTLTGRAQVHRIKADGQGNVYVALSYVNNLSVGNLVFNTVSQSELCLLIKFDNQGTPIWYHEFVPFDYGNNTYNEISEFRAIAVDNGGNLIIGYSDFFKSIIEKISSENGSSLQMISQNNVRRITAVATDDEGNIYTTGSCADANANFNGTEVTTDLAYNCYLAKYNTDGMCQWVKYVEDITCSAPEVVVKSADEVYFSSVQFIPLNFDNIASEGPVSGFDDFFLAKLNRSGNYQWVKEIEGTGAFIPGNRNFLSLDAEGNIYVAGRSHLQTNWGNGITTTTSNNEVAATVVKYNTEGSTQFAKLVSVQYLSKFDGVSTDLDGNIYLSGMATGPIMLDSFEHNPVQTNQYYPIITKLTNTTATIQTQNQTKALVFPNPAKNVLYINGIKYADEVMIYNILGEKIMTTAVSATTGINISSLASGQYFLKTEASEVFKFIKTD